MSNIQSSLIICFLLNVCTWNFSIEFKLCKTEKLNPQGGTKLQKVSEMIVFELDMLILLVAFCYLIFKPCKRLTEKHNYLNRAVACCFCEEHGISEPLPVSSMDFVVKYIWVFDLSFLTCYYKEVFTTFPQFLFLGFSYHELK